MTEELRLLETIDGSVDHGGSEGAGDINRFDPSISPSPIHLAISIHPRVAIGRDVSRPEVSPRTIISARLTASALYADSSVEED